MAQKNYKNFVPQMFIKHHRPCKVYEKPVTANIYTSLCLLYLRMLIPVCYMISGKIFKTQRFKILLVPYSGNVWQQQSLENLENRLWFSKLKSAKF